MVQTASARDLRRVTDGPEPVTDRARSELAFDAPVAPGVTVTWDPAAPHHCLAFHIARPTDESVATEDRVPWLRLAAVEALDHRLYLPLNRSLLDAEIAAAQLDAARTLLKPGTVGQYLARSAFVLARRSSRGVVSFLDSFVDNVRRPPPALEAALVRLVRCYTALIAEVHRFDDEPDTELAAVPARWQRLTAIDGAAAAVERRTIARAPAPGRRRSAEALIDPRQLPARVLQLGPSTDAAEIDVTRELWQGRPVLRVRVPAFEQHAAPHEVTDVGIRLIDCETGAVHGYGLLGEPTPAPGDGARYLEGLVVLPDSVTAREIRVDLYGVGATDPAPTIDHEELRRARRATLFLSDWRALVADVRLSGADARPVSRLRTIVRQLSGDGRPGRADHEPLWSGGPSSSQLRRLIDLGDRALAALLRGDGTAEHAEPIPGDHDGGAAATAATVSGPGDLLVAELAAAHDRSTRPLTETSAGTPRPTSRRRR